MADFKPDECLIDIISLAMQRSHHPSSGRMYICLDGVFVRSNAGKDRFHEGKVGFICTDERESAGNRLRILNKRYVSSFEDSYVFGGRLRGEALRLAMRAYKEVFIIGDGAGFERYVNSASQERSISLTGITLKRSCIEL